MDEDIRELSLILAGWMIYLGGKAATPAEGRDIAEANLIDGKALDIFIANGRSAGRRHARLRRPWELSQTQVPPRVLRIAQRLSGPHGLHEDRLGRAASGRGPRARRRSPWPRTPDSRCGPSSARASGPGSLCLRSSPMMKRLFAEPERLLTEAVEIADEPAPVPPLIAQIITAENKNQFLEFPAGT